MKGFLLRLLCPHLNWREAIMPPPGLAAQYSILAVHRLRKEEELRLYRTTHPMDRQKHWTPNQSLMKPLSGQFNRAILSGLGLGFYQAIGHTPVESPVVTDYYANIDTGAYFNRPGYGKRFLTTIVWPSLKIYQQINIE